MTPASLSWLVDLPDLPERITRARTQPPSYADLVAMANSRVNFLRTEQIDRLVSAFFPLPPPDCLAAAPIRLAVLGSSTTKHLHASIRVAALRRQLHVEIYEPDYGQYWAELLDTNSDLHRFVPNVVLFAFDARHLTRPFSQAQDPPASSAALTETIDHLQACWTLARKAFEATILQQAVLPIFPELMGQNEHLLPGSPANVARNLNAAIREVAGVAGVHLVAVDTAAARDGIEKWYSETFWHQAKQEVSAGAAPLYGDLVMRLVGARFGRSFKCLVLDLDNTIWGGVAGDDGVPGLTLGQGSAEGEAFIAFQHYALALSKRGVILAVCSKNDEQTALAPFEQHPEMVLRRSDIACFIANWDDKATNLRRISAALNIGLDALVFVDDNPFERNLIRRELPMVAVPEIPEEPALVAQCVADAGYFEALMLTKEDRLRAAQYQADAARARLASSVTQMGSYLKSLEMRLIWSRFDEISLPRIVQLINKTNQFNLTTRRYNEDDVRAMMRDPTILALHLRLLDRFGDNGIIAIAIVRVQGADAMIDTWLMSCRVLGREVEQATLALLVEQVAALGAQRLLGHYVPTAKNGIVATHYQKLGFVPFEEDGWQGQWYSLHLNDQLASPLPMTIQAAGFTTASQESVL